MQFKRRLFILLLFFQVITTLEAQHYCIAGRFSETPLFNSSQIIRDTGIIYGYSHNPFSNSVEALKMDIYYPDMNLDTMTRRPLIVSVHGGGFSHGGRGDNADFCAEFAARGYVSATIDYRLYNPCGGNECSDCIQDTLVLKQATYMAVQDLKAALRFLAGNAVGYHVNPNVFFLQGTSAGAMACYLTVAWTQTLANNFAPGAVSLLGSLDATGNDFSTGYTIKGISDFCGAIPGDTAILQHLHIPVISFHDEFDCNVPYVQGHILGCGCNLFYNCIGPKMIFDYNVAHGESAELNTVSGSGQHCSYPEIKTILRTSCFFKRVLCDEFVSEANSDVDAVNSCDSLFSPFEVGTEFFTITSGPNPANENIVFSFSDYPKYGGTLTCYNYLGQECASMNYPPYEKTLVLNTQNLPAGVYFVFFDSHGKHPPVKILVCHPQ